MKMRGVQQKTEKVEKRQVRPKQELNIEQPPERNFIVLGTQWLAAVADRFQYRKEIYPRLPIGVFENLEIVLCVRVSFIRNLHADRVQIEMFWS